MSRLKRKIAINFFYAAKKQPASGAASGVTMTHQFPLEKQRNESWQAREKARVDQFTVKI